jgi:hypothetical protein
MKFRPNKRYLTESLLEQEEVDGRAGVIALLRRELAAYSMDHFPDKAVHIDPYIMGIEERTGWMNVYIVTLDGYGVIGFVENWNGD